MVCRALSQMSAIKLAMADTQEWRQLFTLLVGILILYSKNVLGL